MRDRTAREMREFERRAREAGVAMEEMRPAHYALCAALDDVVLNTPWGAHGRWSQRTLSSTFHERPAAPARASSTRSGSCARTRPSTRPCSSSCTSAWRSASWGRSETRRTGRSGWSASASRPTTLIAGARSARAGAALGALAGRGCQPTGRARTRFPVWVAFCAVLAALAGGFVWVLNGLNQRSDQFSRPHSPRRPPPCRGSPARRWCARRRRRRNRRRRVRPTGCATALATEIGAASWPSRQPVGHHPAAAGPRAVPGAQRGAGAQRRAPCSSASARRCKPESGPIRVLGYTDSQPVRTVSFPSNFALSTPARRPCARRCSSRSETPRG